MQEFAECLREYSPGHEAVIKANAAADKLGKVKAELDQQRLDKEKKLKKEQEGERMRIMIRVWLLNNIM